MTTITPNLAGALAAIRELLRVGLTTRQIAAELRRRNVPKPSRRAAPWAQSTVHLLIERHGLRRTTGAGAGNRAGARVAVFPPQAAR